MSILGLDVTSGVLALGIIQGMSYGVIAVGLVLVYRSSRIINFAHGETGAFGAALCGLLVVRFSVPYWVAFAAGIAVSAAIAGGTEAAVVRRLRKSPPIMSLVGTLGVAQLVLLLSATMNRQVSSGSTYPQPPGLPTFDIGVLRVTPAYSAMLFITPVLVVAMAVFLRRHRIGLALRAAATNAERASLIGISAGQMSTIAWMLGGAFAAYTATLLIPTRGFLTAEFLGPVLLLRALVPAVVARLSSLPVALGAGVAIGLVEQVLLYNHPTSGLPDLVLFGIVVGALLLQRTGPGRERERADWRSLLPWARIPTAVAARPEVRRLSKYAAFAGLGLAVATGLLATNTAAVSFVSILAFATLGLSVGVVTGLSGMLSLGQVAVAGVGALASAKVLAATGQILLAVVAAVIASAVASVLIGLPALKIRGLMLGVTSLAFAVAAQRWVFPQSWAYGDGISTKRPTLGPLSFDTTRQYYWFALGLALVGLWLAANVWRGPFGLRLRAVRDNEDAVRAFGLWPAQVRVESLVLAGMLAGLAGVAYGHLLSRLSGASFDVSTGINVVALTVLGGIGILVGPLLGALYIIGVPAFLPLDSAGLAATAAGWLVLLLYFPGGLAQLVAPLRDRFVRRAAGDLSAEEPASERLPDALLAMTAPRAAGDGSPLLVVEGLTKRYGGVVAVDDVSLDVRPGEILGLIGSNGAGKTTLFELVGGFTAPDAGRVLFRGVDITGQRADARARRGLVRSFQDAALFPTLTVTECLTLAVTRGGGRGLVASCVGLRGQFDRHRAEALALVDVMGLAPYRDKAIGELSTGTRRVTELACVLALGPELILLDEPSSGIAQREVEALGELLLRLKGHLGATLVLIEHDMPLVMGLADRIVAMDAGRVIATGTPEEVRADPEVVRSYLGGSAVAIARSGRRQLAAVAP